MFNKRGEQCEIDRELINLWGKEDMNQRYKQTMEEWMKDKNIKMYKKL